MQKVNILILVILFLVGCATNKPLDQSSIIQQASNIAPAGNQIYYSHIPSHGAISDAVAIAANGGANATRLKNRLEELESQSGGSIVVVSENPLLSKTVIESAVNKSNIQFKYVWIIYAGTQENSSEIEKIVKAKGISYGFILLN